MIDKYTPEEKKAIRKFLFAQKKLARVLQDNDDLSRMMFGAVAEGKNIELSEEDMDGLVERSKERVEFLQTMLSFMLRQVS